MSCPAVQSADDIKQQYVDPAKPVAGPRKCASNVAAAAPDDDALSSLAEK